MKSIKVAAWVIAGLWFLGWGRAAVVIWGLVYKSALATLWYLLLVSVSAALLWGSVYGIGRLVTTKTDTRGTRAGIVLGILIWVSVFILSRTFHRFSPPLPLDMVVEVVCSGAVGGAAALTTFGIAWLARRARRRNMKPRPGQ